MGRSVVGNKIRTHKKTSCREVHWSTIRFKTGRADRYLAGYRQTTCGRSHPDSEIGSGNHAGLWGAVCNTPQQHSK